MPCPTRSQRRHLLPHPLPTVLKVSAVLLSLLSLITPLRNALIPAFLWYPPWDDVHTLKLLRIHLLDLFYPIDRTPYNGPCQHLQAHLAPLKDIHPEDLPVYSEKDWNEGFEKLKGRLSREELWKVEHFRPSLTVQEQRELLYSVLVLTRALDIFNITYVVAEGTLIGVRRHHGLIPWDDDVDVMVAASQWRQAKELLSCLTGFSLSMGRDFMWKFMWNRSRLWKGETFIRFPYVDVFPFNGDDEHVWPLTIWMKREIIWRKEQTFPLRHLPLEGQYVPVPFDPASILRPTYGPDTDSTCASRGYKRKEREPFPMNERVRVPCEYLHGMYPFVFPARDPEDGRPVLVRRVGGKVIGTFKPDTGGDSRRQGPR